MKFSLFRKPKQQSEPEKPAVPAQGEPTQQTADIPEAPKQEQEAAPQEPIKLQAEKTVIPVQEQPLQEPAGAVNKTYLKAMPLKELADIENVKNEVKNGNIIILRVTPLANKNIEEVKNAVNELYAFAESVGGDIARLGEERVVICPKNIRIWREKTPASSEPLPTAA